MTYILLFCNVKQVDTNFGTLDLTGVYIPRSGVYRLRLCPGTYKVGEPFCHEPISSHFAHYAQHFLNSGHTPRCFLKLLF